MVVEAAGQDCGRNWYLASTPARTEISVDNIRKIEAINL
jgi:hypothetical protein